MRNGLSIAHRRSDLYPRPQFASNNRVLRSAPWISRMLKISSQWLVLLRAAQLNLAKVTLRNLD